MQRKYRSERLATSLQTLAARRLAVLTLVAIMITQAAATALSQDKVSAESTSAKSAEPSDLVKSQILQMSRGTFIEVKLIRGGKLRGRLDDVVSEGFVLQAVSHNRLKDIQVRFDQLQSVRPVDRPNTTDQAFDRNLWRTREIVGIVAVAATVVLLSVTVAR